MRARGWKAPDGLGLRHGRPPIMAHAHGKVDPTTDSPLVAPQGTHREWGLWPGTGTDARPRPMGVAEP